MPNRPQDNLKRKRVDFAQHHLQRVAWVALFVAAGLSASLLLQPWAPRIYLAALTLTCALSGWFAGPIYGAAAGLLASAAGVPIFLTSGPPAPTSAALSLDTAIFAMAAITAGCLGGEWKRKSDRMAQNAQQYLLLLDGMNDHALFLLDEEGRVAVWNTGAQRIKGYTAAEILGKSHSIFYTADDVAKGEPQALLRAAARQGSVRTEGHRVRKDGTKFWADVSITALFDDAGRIQGFAKGTRDITELRQSQEAVQAKESELRSIVEAAPDAVLVVDRVGNIVFLNGRTETMFGYSKSELLGKKVELLVPKAKRDGHVARREGYQQNSHVRPMGMGLDLYGMRKDGSEFPVEISLGPVDSGHDSRFVASVRDVSERRGLERELQNRKIQEMAQLMVRDLDGRILQWNAGMTRAYGYTREEAEGTLAHELLRTTFPIQRESIEAELLRTGFWAGELVHRTKDRRRIIVNSSWVLHRDKDGQPSRILESSTDVTALKEAEARARHLNQELEKQNADLTLAKALIESQTQKIAVNAKMSALGEMAGGMAHEINNPMGIIHARASDLMEAAQGLEGVPSQLVVETMDKIRNTASRVTKIILGLRKFARETRNDPFTEVSLQELIEDTLSFCTQRLKQNSIELRVAPVDKSFRLQCKPTEISQVLLNLLNNSVDAVASLPEKWVELTIKDTGRLLEISITDSGLGIPEKVRDKMGQPFFTTKEVGQGTGLGLSISRGIVQAHGGTLRLDSDSKNTRFVIVLPKAGVLRTETAMASR